MTALKSGSKVRICASFDDFSAWQLGSNFSMGQDVYVLGARGRYALISSKLEHPTYKARVVPVRLLKRLEYEKQNIV